MSTDATNILIVDDDASAVQRYAGWLGTRYAVRTATTHGTATAALDGAVDVLILSATIPGYGTDAVLREVRYRALSCPILLVDEAAGRAVSSVGAATRLAGAIDGPSLVAAVDALVEGDGGRGSHRTAQEATGRPVSSKSRSAGEVAVTEGNAAAQTELGPLAGDDAPETATEPAETASTEPAPDRHRESGLT